MLALTRRTLPLLTPLVLLAAGSVHAFQLVPIQATFRPSGADAVQSFRLENPSNEVVTVEISVAQRKMNLDGTDELVPDEESFVVVPTQVVLQPKQVQSVRVQWVGSTQLSAEAAFRLIAEQTPVEVGAPTAQGGRLKMLVRYVASLYVAPAGVQSKLSIESVEKTKAPDGSEKLAVVVANLGTAHQILRDAHLALSDKAGAHTDSAPEEINGQNLLAGAKRRFLVPVPPGVGEGPLVAELRFP